MILVRLNAALLLLNKID